MTSSSRSICFGQPRSLPQVSVSSERPCRRQGGSQGMVHVVGAPAPAAVQRRARIERGAPMYVS